MGAAQVSTVATRPSAGYLPGLDGLRALSVTAVLLYHADMDWIPGGFLGVEVFFVISGYLITLLLTEEYARSSRISLPNFWLRRARRLLPALYLLLATVSILVLVFFRDEVANLAAQVWSALGYVTNWYFIFSEQSYFAAVERPPVLQHLWSLAIEEQFYLVWPLALFGLLTVLGHNRRAMAFVIFAGAALSTLWMAILFEPAVDPSRPYYGTDTRASGLLLGAALAMLWRPAKRWSTDSERNRTLVEIGGLAGVAVIVVCFLRMEEFDSFLYRGGFFVVGIASLLAIMSAVHPATMLGRLVLGNTVLVWIGVRSYSLYLWHWPIFIFTRPDGIDQPLGVYPTLLVRLALTVVAAELSYRYVEVPIRNGAFKRWRQRLATRDGARRRTGPIALAGAAVLLLVAVSTVKAGPSDAEQQLLGQENVPPPTSTTVAAIPDPPVLPDTTQPTTTQPGFTTTSAAATTTTTTTLALPTTVAPPAPAGATITVLADSVLMGAEDQLTNELTADGYEVDFRKQTAWQLDNAVRDLTGDGRPVGPVVVIGIGHDARWERDRANYDEYAQTFDEEADELLAGLRSLGAERFVWVTLNETDRSLVPERYQEDMYDRYNWYFPYVNERLRLLPQRHPDLVLADWTPLSNVDGVFYDSMHLLPDGIRAMIDTIRIGGNI